MAKILLSIPDALLEKIDDIRQKKKLKRNQLFINAVEKYFSYLWEEEYFEKKRQAVESMRKTREEIKNLKIKDWDPVAEIRNLRDKRADELLERWKTE